MYLDGTPVPPTSSNCPNLLSSEADLPAGQAHPLESFQYPHAQVLPLPDARQEQFDMKRSHGSDHYGQKTNSGL
ncbi:hypothetical protein D3C71_691860 [compost metagenome]